ncbi:MAG: sterol desaturase family protein [Acidobacteriota bacterium]
MNTNYIALAIPIFFIMIFIELLLTARQGKHYYRFNDAITDLSCGISQQSVYIFTKGILYAGYAYIYSNYALFSFSKNSLLCWVVAFFGVDFCYYWWHRLSHQVNFLWAVHVVHHQSEDYNLAVALRQAWFSNITGFFFYLPLALLGIHPLVFITINSFSTLYQFWIHTRAIGKLGALEHIINTPSLHRVHHGRNYKYIDKNHGATLMIWDKLFGTYQEEEEEPFYGTVKPYTSWNPLWANIDYWAMLARDAWQAPYFIDKIKIWFMYPGWQPRDINKPASIQTNADQRIRYFTSTPRGLNRYIFVQFWLVSLTISLLMLMPGRISTTQQLGLVAIITLTMLVWGGLFEKRFWAFPLELIRLALLAGIATFYTWHYNRLLPIGIVVTILFVIWLLRYRSLFFPTQPQTATA